MTLHDQDRMNAFARGFLESRVETALLYLVSGNIKKAAQLLDAAKEDAEREAQRNLHEVTI